VLSKINRLTKKKDLDLVFKKGTSLKSDFLIFKVLKNNSKKLRVGFIVSKKVANKATVRNKIKRRLRAAVLSELKKNNKSADIIIIALPGAQKKEFSEIMGAVSKFFKN